MVPVERKRPTRKLLTAASVLMILLALPMAWWCLMLGDTPTAYFDPEYGGPANPLGSLGCLMGIIAYLISLPAGILGIARRKSARSAGVVLMAAVLLVLSAIACILLRVDALFTMTPLVLCTALYLAGALKRSGGS